MKGTKAILLFGLTFGLAAGAFGQTFKLDEFRTVDDFELKSRVDWIFTHLNYSSDTKSYVIIYAAVDERLADTEQTELLVRIRRFVALSPDHEKRIVTIFGGFRKVETAEIYIVPKDSEPPQPSWTIANSGGKKDALLWSTVRFREEDDELDEFVNRALMYRLIEQDAKGESETSEYVVTPNYIPNEDVPIEPRSEPQIVPPPPIITEIRSEPEIPQPLVEAVDRTDEIEPVQELTTEDIEEKRFSWINRDFADAVKKRDGAHGVMIVYADDMFYDIGRLHMFVEQGRDRITAKAEIGNEQISVVFGGYRGQAQIEYYIVPEDGIEPEAKEEER